MIQQEYKNSVTEVSGNVTTTGFTVEANASVYAMLTQNVYNDPILAVMREYSTNACDACLAAEKPVKYDVHLPTVQEPVFFVRDYGTGLSPEDIIGLFSTLGASTKRDSNLYNGSLGIGRMAGLAVADAFTIESYYKGICYMYAVSMKEGIPVTLHLGNSATNEPNGLKLSVSVQNEDIHHYKEKANTLYKYFDYKPNINDDSVVLDLNVTERISDKWYIRPSENYYDYDNFIVMSQVAYQIPRNSAIQTHELRRLVLQAEPGAVTFNPGRESLSLDKKTIAYLNKAFDEVQKDYATAATTALAASNNDAELVNIYYNVIKGIPTSIVKQINLTQFMSPELQALTPPTNYSEYVVQETDAFETLTNSMLTITCKNSYKKTARCLTARDNLLLRNFYQADHVIIDMKTKYKSAINQYYENATVVIWQRAQGEDLDTAVTQAKQYLKALGLSYKLASEITTTTPVNENTTLPREGLYVSNIDARSGKVYRSQTLNEASAKNGTYLYVKLHNIAPKLKDEDISFGQYIAAYNLLARINPIPPIKGVAKKYQSYVDQLDNWIDFETYIKDTMKNTIFTWCEESFYPILPHAVNKETIHNFPIVIQQYYENINSYEQYIKTNNFLIDASKKALVEYLGASVETFIAPYKNATKILEKQFHYTLKALSSRYLCLEGSDVLKLAKLEEFCAVHSTEQQ